MRPQISPIPDVVVNEGEDATLTCTASGVPTPNVEWIKEGVAFSNQKVSSSIGTQCVRSVCLLFSVGFYLYIFMLCKRFFLFSLIIFL